MALDPILREMIGDVLADAVEAARERLDDESVMARCAEGLWSVEVGGDVVASGLSHDDAVETLGSV